jgi:L-rhamnose isomerase
VHIGLDYFDASINRIAAWTVGLRAAFKAILAALLEPTAELQAAEADGDFTRRLALMEEYRNLPTNAVWDMLCLKSGVPAGLEWIEEAKRYEKEVLSKRD